MLVSSATSADCRLRREPTADPSPVIVAATATTVARQDVLALDLLSRHIEVVHLRSAVVEGTADTPPLRSCHHAYLTIVRAAVEVVQLVARFARCHTLHVSTSSGSCPSERSGSLLLLEWAVRLLLDVVEARFGLELELLLFPNFLL